MANKEESGAPTASMQISYIKGSAYREIFCQGALGGVTPRKMIWMSLFAERPPIPRVVTVPAVEVGPGVMMIDEATRAPLSVESRSGIVRSVEVSAYFDLQTARQLRDWLNVRIAELESQGPVQ